jgi:hypothetical protein
VDEDDLLWTVATGAAALGAATLAKKVLTKGWTARRGKAPGNPAAGDTTWGEAVTWAVLSGVVVGVVRLVAERGVAAAFRARKGSLPSAASEQPPA